jgi:preprotein translocase subunit SecA
MQAQFDLRPDLSYVNQSLPIEALIHQLREDLREHYEGRCKKGSENGISVAETERNVLLRVVDQKWMDHIDDMDRLRDGIGLRAYGQRDPVVEYKMEGSNMFEEMVAAIQNDTVRTMFHLPLDRVVRRAEAPKTRLQLSRERAAIPGKGGEGARTQVRAAPKIGRNDPCPCGSGKKYKNCHGKSA